MGRKCWERRRVQEKKGRRKESRVKLGGGKVGDSTSLFLFKIEKCCVLETKNLIKHLDCFVRLQWYLNHLELIKTQIDLQHVLSSIHLQLNFRVTIRA